MKKCRTCKQPKPLDAFRIARAHFRRVDCRECENAAARDARRLRGYGAQPNQHTPRHEREGFRRGIDTSGACTLAEIWR